MNTWHNLSGFLVIKPYKRIVPLNVSYTQKIKKIKQVSKRSKIRILSRNYSIIIIIQILDDLTKEFVSTAKKMQCE